MCNPVALAGAQFAIQAGQGLINANAQEKVNRRNFETAVDIARSDAIGQYSALQARQMEERTRAAAAIAGARKQAAAAAGRGRVAAGEAGVAGVSVDAMLGDFERSALELETAVVRGNALLDAQIGREMKGIEARAAGNMAAAVPNPVASPNYLQFALDAFTSGLNYKLAITKTKPLSSAPTSIDMGLEYGPPPPNP